jgi:hypothetical protein
MQILPGEKTMSIRDIVRESNQEIVVLSSGECIDIKHHLAINKTLLSTKKSPHGNKYGFFKLMKGTLQVHLCIADKEGNEEWHEFLVLDANENQKEKNKVLNVRDQ